MSQHRNIYTSLTLSHQLQQLLFNIDTQFYLVDDFIYSVQILQYYIAMLQHKTPQRKVCQNFC